MARHIDEDEIHLLLLEVKSDEENSAAREPEDHIEADPVHEMEDDDEVSIVNEEQFPDQDYEASSNTSSQRSIEDATPSTSADPSDLIIRPSRPILLGKDKHIWSSQQSRSQSRRPSRNIDI
ncbi:uncharacterized protein LOC123691402 [Colias croceus]|uniref:uncharacterized protein LOC123691402 n=1 Tax=Colias crocea TaxID=72248 RepID=UPI001E27D3FB|nr:uncharacterized protein LOC123691402 [Colias croceus]